MIDYTYNERGYFMLNVLWFGLTLPFRIIWWLFLAFVGLFAFYVSFFFIFAIINVIIA